MIVKPETYKNLIAIKDNKIVKIPNMVLRKIASKEDQDKNLTKNSVCIVCNFRFLEEKVEWSKKIKAICHPFKDDSIFPANIDKYLFSESDFCDKLTTITDYCTGKWSKYDFVYFTLISREGTRSKGLYLLSLLNEIAGDLKLRGLIVNYSEKETSKHKGTIYHSCLKKIKNEIENYKNLKIVNNKYSSQDVCDIMKSVKFVFLPSDADASPRLLVEALVRDVPLVVNNNLYGGWKYIGNGMGSFFKAPSIEEYFNNKYDLPYEYYKFNLKRAIEDTLSITDKKYISKSFYKEYGFINSGKKLAKIINKISDTDYKMVVFKEWEKSLKKVVNYGG